MVMNQANPVFIQERKSFISTKGKQRQCVGCEADSVAGSVSQRACVYSGARVVLNPISDALHLVHGPIGCASYTWDIRGSLSADADLFRFSFSTDLKERDIIFGGEKKLGAAIEELVEKYHPSLVLVYSTCVVGVIGDDMEAVCKEAGARCGIPVLPVQSSGFSGTKSDGYRIACEVLMRIMELENHNRQAGGAGINYLGDYNLAGEAWIIAGYLQRMGVRLNTVFTGGSSYASLQQAPRAVFNIVQCSGSMGFLARRMQERYGMPYFQVSFLGVQDTANSLRMIAQATGDNEILRCTEDLIAAETAKVMPQISYYRERLVGKKAAVYVGGGFKAISLIRQFAELGIDIVMIGTQNGRKDEYETIHEMVADGTVVLDDANPSELEAFMLEQGADLLVGGVKERALAFKMGMAFIDHNHDRKQPLSGFEGAVNFAREVYSTVCSPVWQYTR